MGNKYSVLSDFEINKLVAKELHRYRSTRFVGDVQHGDDVEIFIMDSGKLHHYGYFNICEDDATVFALMIDNKISLRYISLNGKWEAIGGIYSDRLTGKSINTTSVNENPCRAIAECYLLIKDAENG